MYPSQQYPYQGQPNAPPQPQSQSQQPGPPPSYPAYSYPPPPPQGIAHTQGYPQYPQPGYSYPPPPQEYYYSQTGVYPSSYGTQPHTYPPTYSRPPYTSTPTAIPPQYPQHSYPYPVNGYHHGSPAQSFQGRPGHSSPPSKRQKLEPRPPQSNGTHPHKQVRNPPKEKKTFSDFRVSRIKVGEFVSEETRLETDIRDSRLRFYFRSPTSNSSPRQSLSATNAAVQEPDRLSVSLHKGTQRIVIPASRLTAVYFNRGGGYVKVEGDGYATFEEIRSDDMDDTASTTSKSGYTGSKFIASELDPTEGEWLRTKTMEIWLNTTHPLTEPKWTRGNLRDNIDQSSLFQYIIHVKDVEGNLQSIGTFDEIMDSWSTKSIVATVDVRTAFVADLTATERLADLVEKTVQMVCHPLVPAIEKFLSLVKDKESLQDELKQVILRLPYDGIWRALDSMMLEDAERQTDDTQSVMSSVIAPNKREREDDVDDEMETAVIDNQHVNREQSVPIATANREPEIRVSVDGNEDGETDFPIQEVENIQEDEEKTFGDFDV